MHFGADLQRPIACGEVAVFPGDVMLGDGDGVVVIPRAIADEVARDAVEQERLEVFIQAKVAEGTADRRYLSAERRKPWPNTSVK